MNRCIMIIAMLMLTGCVSSGFTAPTPSEFAELQSRRGDSDRVLVKAVNSSGIVYRVRTEPQTPTADLAFWRESLARKLENDGYRVLGTKDITMAGRAGALLEAVAPLAQADYGFLVAIAPIGKDMLIVEGAGERLAWDKAKPQMLAAATAITAK